MIRALLMELQRWNKQRVVVCRECGPMFDGRRLRAPLAANAATAHWNRTDHRVKVKRFG